MCPTVGPGWLPGMHCKGPSLGHVTSKNIRHLVRRFNPIQSCGVGTVFTIEVLDFTVRSYVSGLIDEWRSN